MKMDTIIERMREIFITREYFDTKFTPIEKIIYGFVGMVMVTVVAAIMGLVIVKGR